MQRTMTLSASESQIAFSISSREVQCGAHHHGHVALMLGQHARAFKAV